MLGVYSLTYFARKVTSQGNSMKPGLALSKADVA